jgi:hypothetical protein
VHVLDRVPLSAIREVRVAPWFWPDRMRPSVLATEVGGVLVLYASRGGGTGWFPGVVDEHSPKASGGSLSRRDVLHGGAPVWRNTPRSSELPQGYIGECFLRGIAVGEATLGDTEVAPASL